MFDMTEENLNAMIREVIIPQIKPQSTRNSYFRKQEDKRRLMRFIPIKRLENIVSDFYSQFVSLRFPKREWYWTNTYIGVRGGAFGLVYSEFTGRIKKNSNCVAKKDVRSKRLMKKIQRRQPRKCKVEIANGSAYKKIKMRIPTIG